MSSSLRNLDLNLIKVFDAIYSTRSVSGAARRMGVSQPSVSRGLGRLRDHFDDPLFERSGNGVAPTPKAESILESVKAALSLLEEATEDTPEFDPDTDKRHFRMLMPDFIEATVMPAIINDLSPNSQLSFEAVLYAETDMRTALTEKDIDIGVVPFMPSETDLNYRHLLNDHFVIVARKGHPELKDGFSWPLLDRLGFVVMPGNIARLGKMDEVLRTRNLKRKAVYTAPKLGSFPILISSTDLVSFMSSRYARSLQDRWDLDIFEAPGLNMIKQDIYLAYSTSADNDPAIQWLCNRIETAYVIGTDNALPV